MQTSEMSRASQAAIQLFFGNLKRVDVDQLHFHKEDKSFSQEASSLGIPAGELPDTFRISNPKTRNFRIYTLRKTLMTDSGEDVGGWEYRSDDGLLFTLWND